MKLMKIVQHCRRLHQFILVDCCDLLPALRLVKIVQDCQRFQLFHQRLVKIELGLLKIPIMLTDIGHL